MNSYLSVSGLILTLIGAGILAYAELTSLIAHIRQAESIAPESITPGPWYQNLVVWLARCYGSKDAQALEAYVIPTATKKSWGFFFISVGTLLQILGAI